ncbi:holo-ACP synthase [Paraglaciecola sp. 25GB23A]|jgi:holo-[acyl-carrier protein] synthase|uniref:holo-ACP synthase n=1 Tax=Paraglaciecola sp. 25GB23A TaxID=3156068 RepID=UPI0032AF0185|tara:strand:- start:8253 stop:8627 length:375 start_codon:yes stop_codon:yes gene_type:complete
MSIVGLGTDIVEIARIDKQLMHSERLAHRVLTKNEMQTFELHKFKARFLAKRFAAKEAAVKALGVGIGNGVSFHDVEVVNLASGQPTLRFYGKFAQLCEERGVSNSFISISDEQHYAVATVILE